MIRKILNKIGVSENPIIELVAHFLRYPILVGQYQLLKLHKKKSVDAINLIRTIRKSGDSRMWPTELIQIYHCISSTRRLPGDFAEVGVYRGRSAKLICEAKEGRTLHLFDTFGGLPKLTSGDSADSDLISEKMFFADLDSVKTYLSGYKNVFFYPGMFPETVEPVKNKSFAFVHLDVDLYQGTLECLKFFYPRMAGGGIILSHDYSTLEGVRKAFDEFFLDKDEPIIELSTNQCMVVRNVPPR